MGPSGLPPSDQDETRLVRFAIGRRQCEMWLCRRHERGLRAAFYGFVPYARKVAVKKRRVKADRVEARRIREWARSEGMLIGSRGRLPKDARERYLAAKEGRLM